MELVYLYINLFRSERGCDNQIFTLEQLYEKTQKEKKRVHEVFMDLEKRYDISKRKVHWCVLIMCDVGNELLNGIKINGANNLPYIKPKRGEGVFKPF